MTDLTREQLDIITARCERVGMLGIQTCDLMRLVAMARAYIDATRDLATARRELGECRATVESYRAAEQRRSAKDRTSYNEGRADVMNELADTLAAMKDTDHE